MAENEVTPGATSPSKLPMILALANVLAVLAAVGLLAYIKLVFKRPAITEQGERTRLAAERASPTPPPLPTTMIFEPVTANIAVTPGAPKAADDTPQQLMGKAHYVNIGFALEIRDESHKALLESLRPIIMDRLLQILAHKQYNEVVNVHGRYLLRTEILENVNALTAEKLSKEHKSEGEGSENEKTSTSEPAIVTNAYFTQFLVQ